MNLPGLVQEESALGQEMLGDWREPGTPKTEGIFQAFRDLGITCGELRAYEREAKGAWKVLNVS